MGIIYVAQAVSPNQPCGAAKTWPALGGGSWCGLLHSRPLRQFVRRGLFVVFLVTRAA